jgi:hypothetical protein
MKGSELDEAIIEPNGETLKRLVEIATEVKWSSSKRQRRKNVLDAVSALRQ